MNSADAITTEKIMIDSGYKLLSKEELELKIAGKTVQGEYLYGRRYLTYCEENGGMEGKNDLGTHNFGKRTFDKNNQTITVKWDNGWDHWTGRAYDVDGEIKFYDSTTSKWRTTFKVFKEGKHSLEL